MSTPNERREIFLNLMKEEFLSKSPDVPLCRGHIEDVFTEMSELRPGDDVQKICDLAYELGLSIDFTLAMT